MTPDDPQYDTLVRLLYAITLRPRLFRWRNGQVQWAPLSRPWRWSVLIDTRGFDRGQE